ncbi:MAG: NADP-dependent malic enzyme [Clostridia bacterium]
MSDPRAGADDLREAALKLHRDNRGKLAIKSKVSVTNARELSLAYTPGVAEACKEIDSDPKKVFEYTNRGNLVAVVTDGSAVLGLGNIGPLGGYPVMEGKCILFKAFAGVDALPLCLDTQDPDEIVETVVRCAPTFGSINLEDISAPRCFGIEEELIRRLDIPVFHDDQHGTAVVAGAALTNALKVAEKELSDIRVVINGAGAAGLAIARLFLQMGVGDVVLCDLKGALYEGFEGIANERQAEMARLTNRENLKGSLAEVMRGADVFLGVSAGGVVDGDMVRSMADNAVVIAMANPVPEIYPDEALEAGALVVATGRSDFPNQINNVLAFPGIMAGAMMVRARGIGAAAKSAAAEAIAGAVAPEELDPGFIIPGVFNPDVAPRVAAAVARVCVAEGDARNRMDASEVERIVRERAALSG